MDKILDLHSYVRQIRYFIYLSRCDWLSDNARSVLALHAAAMIRCYRVDDYKAVLVEVNHEKTSPAIA